MCVCLLSLYMCLCAICLSIFVIWPWNPMARLGTGLKPPRYQKLLPSEQDLRHKTRNKVGLK